MLLQLAWILQSLSWQHVLHMKLYSHLMDVTKISWLGRLAHFSCHKRSTQYTHSHLGLAEQLALPRLQLFYGSVSTPNCVDSLQQGQFKFTQYTHPKKVPHHYWNCYYRTPIFKSSIPPRQLAVGTTLWLPTSSSIAIFHKYWCYAKHRIIITNLTIRNR